MFYVYFSNCAPEAADKASTYKEDGHLFNLYEVAVGAIFGIETDLRVHTCAA